MLYGLIVRWPMLPESWVFGRQRILPETLESLPNSPAGNAVAADRVGFGHPSPDTLLRLIRHAGQPTRPAPYRLGIDEWAMKKALTYGTILCAWSSIAW